jgi:conjugative transfer signal peptidase TraF
VIGRAALWAGGGSVLLLAGAWWGGVRLNLTVSLPAGFYLVAYGPPTRGAIVLACLPHEVAGFARQRGYVPHGGCRGGTAPLGKRVIALPGDTVHVSLAGLSVNGVAISESRPRASDSEGRSLPSLSPGRYIVQGGELWLAAPHPMSFDSRYFGPVPRSSVRSVLRPLLTMRIGQRVP